MRKKVNVCEILDKYSEKYLINIQMKYSPRDAAEEGGNRENAR